MAVPPASRYAEEAMRRRRTDPVLNKLRRLARNGRRSEAAAWLEDTLRENPAHAKAREELSRYLTNRPFSFEEVEYEELQKLLADFLSAPQEINHLRTAAIKRLRNRATHLQNTLPHLLSATERNTLLQLKKAISRELQRRRKPMNGLVKAGVWGLGIFLMLGGGVYFLSLRAEEAANAMEQAADQQILRSQALNLLQIHDTGLNRTFNRRVIPAADKLRSTLEARKQRSAELDAILKRIERGEQTVVGQGVRRRAEIERRLRDLGADAAPLQARWVELCRREQKELDQQRLSLAEELMAPLPPEEQLTGDIEQDYHLLTNRRKVLQLRISIYEDAGATLGLPDSLISPVVTELTQLKKVLADVVLLRNRLELLPSAHSYEQYLKQLDDIKCEYYTHGSRLLEVQRHIPRVSTLRGMMQVHGHELSQELLQSARDCLIEGGPSFSTEFPATTEQLHLLNDLLTNSALRTRILELTNEDNTVAYTENEPVIRNGRVYFTRSTLDPNTDAAHGRKEEWLNPKAVWQRALDPRPLYKKLGLENRAHFISRANIPALITSVLQMSGDDAPSLARAYVFDVLLRVNKQSSQEVLSGMRFAPRMREIVTSFEELRDSCGITIDGNCWLQRSAAHSEAEQKFSRWFRQHREVDFAAELKENLGDLLRITPRFCGYVNEQGNAVLFEEPQPGELIWYLSGDSMITTPWGGELQSPRSLSPVFSMKKTF